jgi:TatD DNase family protein
LQDRAEVISRAREAGVAAIIVTGCTVESATAARDLCEAVTDFPLFFTAGVHPHNAKDCDESTLQQLTELAKHERCVAIGERTAVRLQLTLLAAMAISFTFITCANKHV